jgi:probable dihydroxyacetone kinase regulator
LIFLELCDTIIYGKEQKRRRIKQMSNLAKKALLCAFGELIEEKPFNKITITDLTKKCGLNRMTFYYHFDNIYDLMIWGLDMQMREASKDCINYENWKIGYLRIFLFALERKKYIKKIFQTIEQENLEQSLNKIVEQMVISVIDDKMKGSVIDDADKAFAAHICSHVLIVTLVDWISRGMKDNPEDIVNRTARMLNGMIEKAIGE